MGHMKVRRGNIQLSVWAKKMFAQLEKHMITHKIPLTGWVKRDAEYHPDGYDYFDDDFYPCNEGDLWGGPNTTSIFKCSFDMPQELDGKEVELFMFTAGEVIVSRDGEYINGVDPNRKTMILTKNAKGGETYNLKLEAYCRSRPDDIRNMDTKDTLVGSVHYFNPPSLIVIDKEMQGLFYDMMALYEAAYASEMEPNIAKLLQDRIQQILAKFPLYECSYEDLKAAIPAIKEFLEKEIYALTPILGKTGEVALVGHSHLDIAYYWTVEQTVQKNARTVMIQLDLMERYPDFIFSHTQAHVYESLEIYYPELFKKVQQKVKEGKWEVVGGMYVEPDCNLISAESFARQIVIGKKYFMEKFGVDCDTAYMPDVFGNNSIMPQILSSGGLKNYVTHKQAVWNDTNPFPYNLFHWKGIDGTKINVCMPPIHFVTWMDTDETIKNFKNNKQKGIHPEMLQLFGYGDGGSGVTEEMLEIRKRQDKLPYIPTQSMKTNSQYLAEAFAHTDKKYPTWEGDLYLEVHRGTFTSKGTLKMHNRRGEFVARSTEMLATMADINGLLPYDASSIENGWKKLLLNQFHDILPGSHIPPVFPEALRAYDVMYSAFGSVCTKAIEALTEAASDDTYTAVNALGGQDAKLVVIPADAWNTAYNALTDGKQTAPVQEQIAADGTTRFVAYVTDLSLLNLATLKAVKVQTKTEMTATETSLETPFYSIKLNENGFVSSLFDKKNDREIVAEGEVLNTWEAYEDRPGSLNAWDILPHFEDHPIDTGVFTNAKVIECGPVSAAIRMERAFGNSKFVQVMRVYADHNRIDFETYCDWNEEEVLLKAAFPLDIKAQSFTTDTTAGGLVQINNKNTTWQQARYEVPCHKWVDLSEGGYGVTIMSDFKYGCDVKDNVVRLSLLKAPIAPDAFSDRHEHRFTYSIVPHAGTWQDAEVDKIAEDLAFPQTLIRGRSAKAISAPFAVCASNIKVAACKMAEDGSGDIVLRLIEVDGKRTKTTLSSEKAIASACQTNILEQKEADAQVNGNDIALEFRANEIKTVRVRLAK